MDLSRLTERAQEALRRAQALAVRRNHQGVDTVHLLAALLEESEGLAAGCFAAAGIAPSAVRERLLTAIKKIRGSQRVTSPNPEATCQALERYGRDLTKLAGRGNSIR